MKTNFWTYWALFTATCVMPLNGYLFGVGKVDMIFFIILCVMQLPIISSHILKEKN